MSQTSTSIHSIDTAIEAIQNSWWLSSNDSAQCKQQLTNAITSSYDDLLKILQGLLPYGRGRRLLAKVISELDGEKVAFAESLYGLINNSSNTFFDKPTNMQCLAQVLDETSKQALCNQAWPEGFARDVTEATALDTGQLRLLTDVFPATETILANKLGLLELQRALLALSEEVLGSDKSRALLFELSTLSYRSDYAAFRSETKLASATKIYPFGVDLNTENLRYVIEAQYLAWKHLPWYLKLRFLLGGIIDPRLRYDAFYFENAKSLSNPSAASLFLGLNLLATLQLPCYLLQSSLALLRESTTRLLTWLPLPVYLTGFLALCVNTLFNTIAGLAMGDLAYITQEFRTAYSCLENYQSYTSEVAEKRLKLATLFSWSRDATFLKAMIANDYRPMQVLLVVALVAVPKLYIISAFILLIGIGISLAVLINMATELGNTSLKALPGIILGLIISREAKNLWVAIVGTFPWSTVLDIACALLVTSLCYGYSQKTQMDDLELLPKHTTTRPSDPLPRSKAGLVAKHGVLAAPGEKRSGSNTSDADTKQDRNLMLELD